ALELDLGVERQQSPFSSESSSQSCLEKADLDVISQVSTRSSQSGLLRKSRKRTKAKDFQRNSSASSSSTTDCPPKTLRGVCHRLARSLTWFGRLCSPSTACEDTLRKSPSEISTCPSPLCTPLDTFEREVSRRSYANRFIQFSLEFDPVIDPTSRALLNSPRRMSRTNHDGEAHKYRLSMP
ncbi:unnamed protein product, partial [Symbiodinium necroappetens]